MIIRHRIFALIHILCYAATIHGFLLDANDAETCNLLCVQCNATAVFADDRCECNFADDSDKVSGAECIERIQREIQAIELNMLSENPTDEERNVRSLLKYRRRLRPGDAEKVALYFINGGPAAGHSHFVRAFKEAYDSADSAANSFSGDESNPEDGFHGVSLISPVSSNTYDSPLVPEYAPYGGPTMQGAEMYPPIVRAMNPAITYPTSYPTSGLYDPTTSLGPVAHPHRFSLHHALARAVTFPGNVLHHILHPRIFHHDEHIVKSTNLPQDTSDTAKVNQPCENNEDFTSSSFPTARNNENKPAEQNVLGYTAPSQYPYITHALYQPTQYLPYTSYYSPLMNVLHPVANGYVLQPVPHYMQDISNPLTSAPNPQCNCDNVNTEQKSGVLTTDKAIYSNNGIIEKFDDANKHNIFKEEKKPEKHGISKS